MRALLVHGSNVVVSGPDAGAIRSGLEALDLLVVSDFVLSETAELADVVLPVTQWAEEEGTMTNLEGRILRRRRALEPPDGVRSELDI
ncbi:molybdopterin-dependent oxidoreductase, partial [Bacillus sp. SIMBA_069]